MGVSLTGQLELAQSEPSCRSWTVPCPASLENLDNVMYDGGLGRRAM